MINDNDDAIAKLIADMREAAREDRSLNAQGNFFNFVLDFHYFFCQLEAPIYDPNILKPSKIN